MVPPRFSLAQAPRYARRLFWVSICANLIGLAVLLYVIEGRGGISYLKSVFRKDQDDNVPAYVVNREKMFESLPAPDGRPIIFLGDSITLQCEWFELFGRRLMILNRGIGGDTSAGVLKRISNIQGLHPSAVFLMIGTNDPQKLGYAPSDTIRNYRMIIDAIMQASPDARIFAQSILPTRSPKFNRWSEVVNSEVHRLADEKTIVFVDLRPAFSDHAGLLDNRYTSDGIHLNADGYLLWKRQIDPLIKRLPESRRP